MKHFRHIDFEIQWKNVLSNINPKISSFNIKDDQNFILAWDHTEILNLRKFNSSAFKSFVNKNKENYIFGYLSFDAKNEFEDKLSSKNADFTDFDESIWFVPKNVLICLDNVISYSGPLEDLDIKNISVEINKTSKISNQIISKIESTVSKEQYKINFEKIQRKITRGDIYEVNYCQEFRLKNCQINSIQTFFNLTKNTEAPFSCYLKIGDQLILSGSPERFIRLKKYKLTSQPIKGTAKRMTNKKDDKNQATTLLNNKKELSENIMIVDLVRNDLSKIAAIKSVEVEELNQLYSFKSVHQLVSTVTCLIDDNIDLAKIIEATFPMGSMTGAPKHSALKIIDDIENFKRNVYSGALGFIEPNGNFDLNVVIRTILYNAKLKNVSIPVGGAITSLSKMQDEFDECLTKLEATKLALC